MVTSPASYLHTLASDEATALATSLQRIKDHLYQELEWMKGQVEQKTTQLQGFDALLAEVTSREAQPSEPSVTAAPAIPSATQQSTSSAKRQEAAKKTPSKKTTRTAPKKTKAAASPTAVRDIRQFLQNQFQGKPLAESVGEILDQVKAPITAKEVVAQLYKGLSGEAHKRAKHTIANVLTIGRNQGKWKSTGRGLYISNTATSV